MIDTVIKPECTLEIFNFHLDDFIVRHLEDATKDIAELKSAPYHCTNHNITCRMGFYVEDSMQEYQDNLNNAHFTIDYDLNYRSACLAVKPRQTYHFSEELTDREIATRLLTIYVKWLKRRINKMQKAAKQLDFVTLINLLIPSLDVEPQSAVPKDFRVDDVFTRKSLLGIISQHLPLYFKQMKASKKFELHYIYSEYLYWLISDVHLCDYLIANLLSLNNLQKLIRENIDVSDLIITIIHQIFFFNQTPLETAFVNKILPLFNPIPQVLLNDMNVEQYLDILLRAEYIVENNVLTFPLAIISDAFWHQQCFPDLKVALFGQSDLQFLLNYGFKDKNYIMEVAGATADSGYTINKNNYLADYIIKQLDQSVIDFRGNERLILDKLTKLQQKTKPLINKEQNQLRILTKLKSLM